MDTSIIEGAIAILPKVGLAVEKIEETMNKEKIPSQAYDQQELAVVRARLEKNLGEFSQVMEEHRQLFASLSRYEPKLGELIERYRQLPDSIVMLGRNLGNPAVVSENLHHIVGIVASIKSSNKRLGEELEEVLTDLSKLMEEAKELLVCYGHVQNWNLLMQHSREIQEFIRMYRQGTSGSEESKGLHFRGLDKFNDGKLQGKFEKAIAYSLFKQWLSEFDGLENQKKGLLKTVAILKGDFIKNGSGREQWNTNDGAKKVYRNLDHIASQIGKKYGNSALAKRIAELKKQGDSSQIMRAFFEKEVAFLESEQVRSLGKESWMLQQLQRELMGIFWQRHHEILMEGEEKAKQLYKAYHDSLIGVSHEGLLSIAEKALENAWKQRKDTLAKRTRQRRQEDLVLFKALEELSKEMGYESTVQDYGRALTQDLNAMNTVAVLSSTLQPAANDASFNNIINMMAETRASEQSLLKQIEDAAMIRNSGNRVNREALQHQERILRAAKYYVAVLRWMGQLMPLSDEHRKALSEGERFILTVQDPPIAMADRMEQRRTA